MSQRARQAPHAQRFGTEDLRESYDRLAIENEELHSRVSDLIVGRDMAEDQKQRALDQYIEVDKHNRELANELFRLREMNGEESNDAHEQQQKLDELQKKLLGCKDLIDELKGEKKDLERQLRLVSQDNERLSSRPEARSWVTDFWRRDAEGLTEKVSQLERQLEKSNQEKAKLQRKTDQMTDLEQQLQELQAKESGYESQIGGLNQRLKTLATKEKRQEEQIQTLKQSLDQVDGEKNRCEDQLRNHDKTKALADADIKTLKERIAKLEASAEAGDRRKFVFKISGEMRS